MKRREEDHTHQVFYMTFQNAEGEECSMGSYSSYSDYDGDSEQYFIEELPLPDYHESEVWLKPTYTHTAKEEIPITVPIK